jgi:hypothetical protein
MTLARKIIALLFKADNPFRLYGFFPTMVWLVPIVLGALVYFSVFEWLGVARYKGMIPLTWFLRCIPWAAWLIFFSWFIPHLAKHRP